MNVDNLLTTCTPAVENIFKHLSARDLSRCAQVCKLWYSMSVTAFKRRRHIDWFLEEGRSQPRQQLFQKLPNSLYTFQDRIFNSKIHPSLGILLMSTKTCRHLDSVAQAAQPPHKKTRFGSHTEKKMQQQQRETPSVSICQDIRGIPLSPIIGPDKVADCVFKPHLPPGCELYCVTSEIIIGCHDDLTPVELENGANIAGILFPKFPGVEIQHMVIDAWEKPQLPKDPIKCVLIFMGIRACAAQVFVDQCVKNQTQKFALGGGIADVSSNFALVFTGENVEAGSIVIDGSMEGDAISEEMRSFEKTGLLANECFCFVFNCIARDKKYFKAENYQSELFRKIYPKVPLFGMHANGEFGAYYLPNVDPDSKVYKDRAERFGYKECRREYTTIYLLVSIKKPK